MASLPALQSINYTPLDIPNAIAAHYKLQEMQQAETSRNALIQNGAGLLSDDPVTRKNALMSYGQADPAGAMDWKAKFAQLDENQQKVLTDRAASGGRLAGAALAVPDEQLATTALTQTVPQAKALGIPTDDVEQAAMDAQKTGDVAPLRRLLTLKRNASMSVADQFGRQDHADTVAHQDKEDTETHRHNVAMELKAANEAGGDLTPDALDMVSSEYLTNGGQMPAMGMGGGKQRITILNNSAAKAKAQNISGADIATGAASFKANSQALAQITKAQTAIGSYEQTASQNADIALGLMNKGAGPTGSPVVDRWIRAGGKSVAGDADVSKFDTALSTFVSEYAKVMSGGYGAAATSDTMQAHARELLNANLSREQILGNIQVMKQDMANRTRALNDYRSNLIQHIHSGTQSLYDPVTGGSASPAQTTQPQASPGQAGKYPVMQSPADAMRLPPGTLFYTPDGRLKVR